VRCLTTCIPYHSFVTADARGSRPYPVYQYIHLRSTTMSYVDNICVVSVVMPSLSLIGHIGAANRVEVMPLLTLIGYICVVCVSMPVDLYHMHPYPLLSRLGCGMRGPKRCPYIIIYINNWRGPWQSWQGPLSRGCNPTPRAKRYVIQCQVRL
jgi:hypothetical protein